MLSFTHEGDVYSFEYEGEIGCPATTESPETLDEFYITELYINESETDFLDKVSENFLDTLTLLALAKVRDQALEAEAEHQLTNSQEQE